MPQFPDGYIRCLVHGVLVRGRNDSLEEAGGPREALEVETRVEVLIDPVLVTHEDRGVGTREICKGLPSHGS